VASKKVKSYKLKTRSKLEAKAKSILSSIIDPAGVGSRMGLLRNKARAPKGRKFEIRSTKSETNPNLKDRSRKRGQTLVLRTKRKGQTPFSKSRKFEFSLPRMDVPSMRFVGVPLSIWWRAFGDVRKAVPVAMS
jgi:hypothetical protein